MTAFFAKRILWRTPKKPPASLALACSPAPPTAQDLANLLKSRSLLILCHDDAQPWIPVWKELLQEHEGDLAFIWNHADSNQRLPWIKKMFHPNAEMPFGMDPQKVSFSGWEDCSPTEKRIIQNLGIHSSPSQLHEDYEDIIKDLPWGISLDGSSFNPKILQHFPKPQRSNLMLCEIRNLQHITPELTHFLERLLACDARDETPDSRTSSQVFLRNSP